MVSRNPKAQKPGLGSLEKRLGYAFSSPENLQQALTHTSVRPSNDGGDHYERLEFLGDRVLGLTMAQMLYETFPKANEGELSRRLNSLVNGEVLAEIADEIGLHKHIRTGDDIKHVTGKRMRSIRSDVLEAVIAAIYLDGGMVPVKKFIIRFWKDRINDTNAARRDAKTELQEWAHARSLGTPTYRELERTGPDHEPEFTVVTKIKGKLSSQGKGQTKRLAEQAAAEAFLIREGVWKS